MMMRTGMCESHVEYNYLVPPLDNALGYKEVIYNRASASVCTRPFLSQREGPGDEATQSLVALCLCTLFSPSIVHCC